MEPTSSRRDVLRVGGSLAALGLVGGLSGCQGTTSAASDGGPERIDTVPQGVTAAVHVDVTGLLNDQQLRDSLDSFARDAEQTTNVSQALSSANDQLGLDPRKVSELVAFADASAGSYVGLRLWTDWADSTVTDQLGPDSEERTYEDVTVYDTGNGSVAVLGDGQFVAGTTAAVEDALDVRSGGGATVDGKVRTAYTAARSGYVRFGFDVPSGLIAAGVNSEDVAETAGTLSYGYGSLYSSGERTGLTLSFETTDADTAGTVKEQFDVWLARMREQLETAADEQALRERVDGLLEGTEVIRDGSTVTVRTREGGGELAVLTIGAVLGTFALGFGRSRGPDVPQVVFEFEYDGGAGELAITHDGGDSIRATGLSVRGSGLERTGRWDDLGGGTSGDLGGDPAVVAGDRLTLEANANYEATVVWESEDGSASATLAQDTGPGA